MKKALLLMLSLIILLSFIGCGSRDVNKVAQCPHCNEMNLENARFCAICGKAFAQADNLHTEKPTLPTEKPTISTEKPTLPTEKPTIPTEKPTLPTEKPTLPTEKPTLPTEDIYLMQNSGVDEIYYGNSVCVDGDRIYLGYYGNLYILDGGRVTTYAGGGTKTTTIAEMYLYNGYVYYVDMNQCCLCRINAANGSRETVLSGIGEIGESFMYGKYLYLYNSDSVYCVNLENKTHKSLLQKTKGSLQIKLLNHLDKDMVLLGEYFEGHWRLLILNAKNGTVTEGYSVDANVSSVSFYGWKNEDDIQILRLRKWLDDEKYEDFYLKVNKQTHTVENTTEAEYNAATHTPFDNGNEWKYYLSAVAGNLCRENKKTQAQELLVKNGSGNRENGETVAKTYAIKEILYADDRRVILKRSRMADGVEFSIWSVDSDGKNLTELLRKEYRASSPVPYPGNAPGGSGTTVTPQTCSLCQGDGRTICNYCHGTGKGKPIYVMGIPTEQGCSYCGSAGWRLCSGCGGRGEK